MISSSITRELLDLSHVLGEPGRDLAILGEGNTSARLDDGTFLVKASGSCLETLTEDGLVACRIDPLLRMLDREDFTDEAIERELLDCRVDSAARKPSVESLFHAYLLSLPGIAFVGHTHSIVVNQVLCSPRARELATHRLFPDEVVCCGRESVFIPYTDPGLQLSKAIREGCAEFMENNGIPPRVILLENHGLITLGRTPSAVKAAHFMADKAARIFIGAASLGGPVFMTPAQIERIAGRIDEHHRQKALQL